MLPASSQHWDFSSNTAVSPDSVPSVRSHRTGPTLLAKTISAEQCKTEPEWAMVGESPQALEQPTMCSCTPAGQGGSGERSSQVFLLPHLSSPCHSFSKEAKQAGSVLPWLCGTQTGAPWKPPESAGHFETDKTLLGSGTKS
jgi:hypothetical protein